MKKTPLTLLLCCLFLTAVNAQSNANTQPPVKWETTAWKCKNEIRKKLTAAKMPLETEIITGNMPAKTIKINVTGMQNLVLYTWETTDGNKNDQSVWANARLTTMDGKTEWLDQLPALVEQAGYGTVIRNKNIQGKPITINGKKYEHGIFIHAGGELAYALNKRYRTFEAEVGIDDATTAGSVIFKIQNVLANTYVQQLKAAHPQELENLLRYANTSATNWLMAKGAEIEKQAVLNATTKLNNPTFFIQQINRIAAKRTEEQVKSYLALLTQIAKTVEMQEQLALLNVKAIEMAHNDMKKNPAYNVTEANAKLQYIKDNAERVKKDICKGNAATLQDAQKLIQAKRELLLTTPLLKDKQIMAIRRKLDGKARTAMSGALGIVPSNFQNNSEIWNPTNGWDNEFITISDIAGNTLQEVTYKPQGKVIISDPELHFNGNKLLYSSIGTNKRWHIFELDLNTGTSKQVTPEAYKDFDSFDACYTPDGRIIFCATATFLGLPCTDGDNKMCGLFIYDPKTGKTRQLTYDQDSNWGPVVMNNGQILYVRWEYADLPHANSRIIFSMNPDGTTQQAIYGTNSYFPTSFWGARPIPGHPTAFVGTVSGHHSVSRSGRLMIIDPAIGYKEADGVVAEIPCHGQKVLPVVRDRLPDGIWPHFLNPWPLNENYFLVAMKLNEKALWGLYLVDTFDNITLIAEQEGYALLEPLIREKRKTPAVIPDRIDLTRNTATVYLQDVYFGPGLKGIPKGTVKKLRVASYSFSPLEQGGLLGTIGMDGPWDVKRILGTVNVETDGSAMFTVPANTPIFIQPLDEEGKALQMMRSWFTAMPGETLSCLGCHEDKRTVPLPQIRLASRKAPQLIQPWHGKERGFSYRHEVQPVLDRACVACHDGTKPGTPYLKGDRWIKNWSSKIGGSAYGGNGGHFTESYANLHRYVRRPGIESDMDMLSPMDVHADQTELMQILNKGHHGVKLTLAEKEQLVCWIDFNAPFHGRRSDIPGYQKTLPSERLKKQYAPLLGAPDVDYNYLPELPTGIVPELPEKQPTLAKGDTLLQGWPLYHPANGVNRARGAHNAQLNLGNFQMEIPLSQNVSLHLIKVPAGTLLMGSTRNPDEAPRTKINISKPFWIGQFEITNEIYALFDAEHNSRTEYRHGYQFGRKGYPLNKPDQPVVRISWNEAMNFCQWLSKKIGKNFTLPTEAQWEWACRAGSETPFWFGPLDGDFTKYANLGDIRLRDFAACTSFKNYEGSYIIDNPSPYDDWIPRDTLFDDAGFVSTAVGSYRSNPWDIYDMHGNVAEWTRSAYKPYPYKEDDGRNDTGKPAKRVTRGGSWYDRPFRATSTFRTPYREYQKVYNVGFRVVMTE